MFPNLLAEMARANVKKQDIANVLGISLRAFSQRFNNGHLYLAEAFAIKEKLFPNLAIEYLFSKVPSEALS